jgi:hypothetical protein
MADNSVVLLKREFSYQRSFLGQEETVLGVPAVTYLFRYHMSLNGKCCSSRHNVVLILPFNKDNF